MKRIVVYLIFTLLSLSFRTVAQDVAPRPLSAQPPMQNGQVVTPMVCVPPTCQHDHRQMTHDDPKGGSQVKALPINPIAYTQSIHNVIAKWEGGSVYRFDMGTTPGGDNIYQGHLLNADGVNTLGHSFPELQAYAAAQGTTFNIGDQFYLNLYYTAATSASGVPDMAFPLQFQWEDLGNPANNVTIEVETGYGVGGAVPFTPVQAAKMQAFFDLVNPIIKSVYGPPSRNHTITVVNDAYAVGKNVYYNGPNQVSSSFALNADGDLDQPRLIIHEIIHGYRDNVGLSSNAQWHYDPKLSGFEEGFAEGVAIVVMDIFIGMYPNFFTGNAHKLHWNQEGGMPFEWDYDFQNHHQVTTEDFWSSDIATGSHWLRYGMGATAMKKMYYEDNNIFKNFNAEYYSRMNANHSLLPDRALVVDIFATIKTEVERTPTTDWINSQHIFDCTKDIRKKVFMLTFTGLSWNSFQHDNRIIPVETHQNGLEWKWDSSDQAGTNEITATNNSSWAWTHQLNNLTGDITFTRDWNNTNLSTRSIQAKNHWVNEAPTALFPAYIGVPLLGPHQGANPYYVGAAFTRDHEQNNCTAVPGCGKRAWAMGNQPLYTTTSSAATVWPTLAAMGGTPLGDRAELNLTESGLFQFKIGFNDPQGPRIEDTYYRLLGNAFIDIEGVFGGIYSPTANQVDGRMFIEHEGFGAEAQIDITNNYFKGTRLWTSVPETDPNRQGGRTDRRYSVPGQIHSIYLNPDCSQKKIDFRTIGYGDGLDGTEMLLFNVDDFEDIVFTESNDTTICDGDDFNLAVTNNFPDIFAGDSRVTYSWKDPNNTVISTNENYTFAGAEATDAGTYTLDIGFFGCPVFQKTVEVTIGNAPVLSVVTPPALTVCEGDTAALTSNTIVGGVYSWTGPNGFTSSLQNPVIAVTALTDAGIYTVAVTAPACGGETVTASSTINLVVDSNPIVDAVVPASTIDLCENATLSLDVNAVTDATYSWSGPNGFTSSLQSPTISAIQLNGSGIYQIVISVPGCGGIPVTDTALVTVTVQTDQVISVIVPSPTLTVCEGDIVNFSATGTSGVSYVWTGPNGFTSSLQNPTIPVVAAADGGTYTVEVTGQECGGTMVTVSETIDLVVDSNPIVDAVVPVSTIDICENNTLNLQVNAVTGATYEWTGPNGFTSSLQSPAISNIQLNGSGIYQIVISVPGCGGIAVTDTAFVTVTIQTNQVISVTVPSPTLTVCEGDVANFSATGTSGVTYLWTGPNGFTSTLQNPVIPTAIMVNAGVYTVEVSAVDCEGAPITASETVNLVVDANPVVNAVVPSAVINVCENATLSLDVNAVAGATYTWTGPNGFTSSLQSPSISTISQSGSGVYQVVVSVTGCGGVQVNDTANVTVTVQMDEVVAVSVPSPTLTVCEGITIDLVANGTDGATYSWSGPGGYNSTEQSPTISSAIVSNAGIYQVTASLVGCSGTTTATATIDVTVNTDPEITAVVPNASITVCETEAINLTVNSENGATYGWMGPNSFTSALQSPVINNVNINHAGTYQVIVAVPGCVSGTFVSSTAMVNVSVTPTPTVNLTVTPSVTLCPGDMIDLTANTIAGASYSWSGPNGFTSSSEDTSFISVGTQNNGNYSVTATVPGCITGTTISGIATTNVTVNSMDGITLNIEGGQYICEGQTLQLEAVSNGTPTSYQWIGPDGSVVSTSAILGIIDFSPLNVGMYYLTVNYGCETLNLMDSIEVFIQSENICHPKPHYYLPNVFSPNGDRENDVLYVYGDLIDDMELIIYDRFGEIVFTSHLKTHGWDGTYKGNLLNTAVFAYRLKLTFTEGKDPVSESGNITLIR